MKRCFAILMILVLLLAAPLFADAQTDETVDVTVKVSPYATISGLSEISLDTGNQMFGASPYDQTWFDNDFQVLANFPYDLHVTAEETFDDGDDFSLGAKATIGEGGIEGAEIAYRVRVIGFVSPPGPGYSMFEMSQVISGVAKGIVSWEDLQKTGAEAGKTHTLWLLAEITTLTSNSDWEPGAAGHPQDVGSETDLEAWLAGNYEGELTLTVVEAAQP